MHQLVQLHESMSVEVSSGLKSIERKKHPYIFRWLFNSISHLLARYYLRTSAGFAFLLFKYFRFGNYETALKEFFLLIYHFLLAIFSYLALNIHNNKT